MANPSIKIWTPSTDSSLLRRVSNRISLRSKPSVVTRNYGSCIRPRPDSVWRLAAQSLPGTGILSQFDERRKFHFGISLIRGPYGFLICVLPLNHHAGHQSWTIFQRVGERVIAAVELLSSDRANVIGLFQGIYQLIRIGRASTFDCL